MDAVFTNRLLANPLTAFLLLLFGMLKALPVRAATAESIFQSFRPDIVLRHPAAFGVRWICERHQIPCAIAMMSPDQWLTPAEFGSHPNLKVAAVQRALARVAVAVLRFPLALVIEPMLQRLRRRLALPAARGSACGRPNSAR